MLRQLGLLGRLLGGYWAATGRLLGGYWVGYWGYWVATGWATGWLLGGYWVATGWLLGLLGKLHRHRQAKVYLQVAHPPKPHTANANEHSPIVMVYHNIKQKCFLFCSR